LKNAYSESGDQVWKEFGTQSKITADASVQCNIPIEPEKPKTFDACTQCCNIGKFFMKLTKYIFFYLEIVTRKPAKIMSLDNFERKKTPAAIIPVQNNSSNLDDRLRSISKWMDTNEYSF